MNWTRIKAIITQEYYHTRSSIEVIIDIFFFAIITLFAFGFFYSYLTSEGNPHIAASLLIGIIFWEIIRTGQYSISVGSLWNIWSRNLSNIFITPISIAEYLVAHMIVACIKALLILALVSGIAYMGFRFNILDIGLANLASFFVNLMLFAYLTGFMILGVIFRFGTRIQALAWGAIFLFQPLSAAFFPVSVLPPYLQKIAYSFPSTYVFEGGRAALLDSSFNLSYFMTPLVLNIVYFVLSLLFFLHMYRRSRETGQFAKNEG